MGKTDHRRIGNVLEKVEPQLERENHFCNTRGTLRYWMFSGRHRETTVLCATRFRHPSRSFALRTLCRPHRYLFHSIRLSQAERIGGPSCFARLLRPDAWDGCMWTETDFATTQGETTFDAREQCMGTFVAGCGWRRAMPLLKTTPPCSWVTNTEVEPFFSNGAVFLSVQRTPAPSDQCGAAASSHCSLTLIMFSSWSGSAQI